MRLASCLAPLLLLIFVPCVPAGGKARFTDVTAASALRLNPKDQKGQPGYGSQMPHAVAVADLDGDGLPDVLIPCFGEPHVKLYRNLGKLKFADATAGSGLESFQGAGTGVAVGDFDSDGKPDVYLTSVEAARGRGHSGAESRLYRNLGGMKFEDVSKRSGTLLDRAARSCAWADVDNDGRLDLFVTCPDTGNALFRNNGDGTFTDVAARAGVALNGRHCLGCAFADTDGDGRQDLFVTCYKSQASALLRNQADGTFRDVTAEAGLGRKASAVGCVFADVFNRGALDLFVTTDSWLSGANYTEAELRKQGHTVEPNLLYRADAKGRFAPADAATLLHKALSHDAVIEDFDHDGYPDIYVGVDAIPSGNRFATHKGGNPLWTRPDGKAWREAGKEWGVAHEANCVCVPAADLDNDGDLDLLLVNFYTNVVLYRNETNDGNWLRVKLRGSKGNRDGVGAKVTLRDGDGKLVGTRLIQAGSGYCRCGPAEAHFGLGRRPASRHVLEVVFPGSGRTVREEDTRPGRTYVISER